jgi:ABC-type branched-subunit amino acid transport system ATPase component
MSLDVEAVEVAFGGIQALSNVSLNIEPGEIVGLVGPNGSGKSTMLNCISGFVRPSRGSIVIDGQNISTVKAHSRVRYGIGRTFQTPHVDQAASVATTIKNGMYAGLRGGMVACLLGAPSARRSERTATAVTNEIMEQLDLTHYATARIGTVPMGIVRLIEVARALAGRPKYLLLDEPASGLTSAEIAVLAAALGSLARNDMAILLVEHNFQLVLDLSDRVFVLNKGQNLLSGPPEEIRSNRLVMDVYIGKSGDK